MATPRGVVGALWRRMCACISGKLLMEGSALLSRTVPTRKPWDAWRTAARDPSAVSARPRSAAAPPSARPPQGPAGGVPSQRF